MTITVIKPGLQSTLQSRPRLGQRHLGVPAGGAADPLSLALANRLVGNAWDVPAIEATLAGPMLRFDADATIAVVGGETTLQLNAAAVPCHQSIAVAAGDELAIGPITRGARVYVAIAGGFAADEVLGSASTNLQAQFGGLGGRALRANDRLSGGGRAAELLETPPDYRPVFTTASALRVCPAAESAWLRESSRAALHETNWIVDRRADRMGMRLDGPRLQVASDGRMPSAGVMPGTIQCPEDGRPFILAVDAGTVGGYPRIAQVARVDRQLLGQLRPGDHLRLLQRTPDAAVAELRAKIEYWRPWLPDIAAILT